jgi:hypothetical protein
MVALLYAGVAYLPRDVNPSDPETPPSNSAPAEIKATLTSADARSTLADPFIKVEPAEPNLQAESLEASDECAASEGCIDQYLWSVYERTRKIDTITVKELMRATLKKKGHMRTVTKAITKLEDEDFTWKDPQAAQKAGMSVPEYVIGGMD